MKIAKILSELNNELSVRRHKVELYTCGGAALQLLGIITRDTMDIDVINSVLDPVLIEAKNIVSTKLRISEEWLNNKVTQIIERLPPDWISTSVLIFEESHLKVYSLSRQNLINSKLHAAVDRQAEDFDDLVALNPSKQELEIAQEYAIQQSKQIETYEVFVKGLVKALEKELGMIK